jgi:hypothetical protein
MLEKLDESNALLYAARHYDNPQCHDTIEFYDDLKKFQYLKRLFNRYKETGELKERLVINHIIILYNVFGPIPCTRLLFLKLGEHSDVLKPILEFLGTMPAKVENIGLQNTTYHASDIVNDKNIEELLKRI